MSSLSPRAGLVLMADGDFVDAGVVTTNAAKLDTITSITQCLSSSRPATPFDGQWIYETDTKNIRRWNSASSAWYLLGGNGSNSSSGYFGTASNTSAATLTIPSGSSGHSQISLHDYNFSLTNNKIYKIIEQGWIWLTGSFNNTGYKYNVGLWTNLGIGSNPGLGSSSAVHVRYTFISDPQFQQRIPYYKLFYVQTPGGSGSTTHYFRSVMDVNLADFPPASRTLGRSADATSPSTVHVYDMGATTGN